MKKILFLSIIFAAIFSSFVSARDAYLMAEPSYLYELEKDGNLKWAATVDSGTRVYIKSHNDDFVPETINKKANSSKLEFTKVDYEGKTLYTIAKPVVEESPEVTFNNRAVITKPALVYTWGNKSSFENIMLPVGTVVIVLAEEEGLGHDSDLVRVQFYDTLTFWRVRTVYVNKSFISTEKGDYDAVCLAKTALTKDPSKEREIITKLMSSAQNRASDGAILEYLEEVNAKIDQKDISQSAVVPMAGSTTGVINSNGAKVNVREAAGTGSKAVGKIDDGAKITASEKTEMTEKIGNDTDSWYHVTVEGSDISGWIFGSSIKWDEQ
ncbi:SH3 domain-containing protein [Treponema sp.]|uniref:SH3 domain-containing protein n=1 Tax=Treponema sp. TaxID=166 RepID=UPI00298D6DF0|nr:SH3 domain-containing protein [Treponema sp.]MCR5613680.1 SH3 domain-containing protein [Treponema sp.]